MAFLLVIENVVSKIKANPNWFHVLIANTILESTVIVFVTLEPLMGFQKLIYIFEDILFLSHNNN